MHQGQERFFCHFQLSFYFQTYIHAYGVSYVPQNFEDYKYVVMEWKS